MKRSKHSLSNYKLLSCDLGELIPIGLIEVLPGDTIQMATSALVRAAPLLSPVMHPVHIHIRHFFVPHRLVWEDWENFITGGPDGMDDSVFPTLQLGSGSKVTGELGDYLGIPPDLAVSPFVSALPFRGYNLIWNEYYRDQDLQDVRATSLASGVDTSTNRLLARVNWEKDYFTSSRPWEQKGPAITIPLGSTAPVVTNPFPNSRVIARNWASGTTITGSSAFATDGAGQVSVGGQGAYWDVGDALSTDLSAASSITVNLLREAMALQRYEENRARFGSRYTEYLQYLGVKSSDARLQRPEYLGGGKQTMQFSEVLQTAEGEDPVGALKGHGIGAMRSNRFRRFFEEHGYIFSLLSVRPKTVYQQGLPRTWNRRTKEDFWQVELQHIGQQEVLNKEIYAPHASPDGVFGYQDRYDEYRRVENTVAGEFHNTLDYWHFARSFGSTPALNSDFVQCLPTERTFASPGTDVLYIMAHHSVQARRLIAPMGNSFIF